MSLTDEEKQWAARWWDQIAGPCSLVEDAAAALGDGKNVLLCLPPDMPWRSEFRRAVTEKFRSDTEQSGMTLEYIDVQEECAGETDVAQFLLEKYATEEVRALYRGDITVSKYLVDEGVLDGRVLWVKGLGEGTQDRWIAFLRSLPRPSRPDGGKKSGQVVLECDRAGESSGRLAVLSYKEAVSTHDLRLFNNTVLSAPQYRSYPDLWKQYLVALCAELCVDTLDAELSYALLQGHDLRQRPPGEVLARIADEPGFVRRGEDPQHVLAWVRSGQRDLLEQRVWSAQMQVCFPHIEILRADFIRQHMELLRQFLAGQEVFQGPYGNQERVVEPMELEVGSLCYIIARSYVITQEQGEEPHFTKEDKKRMERLREWRNTLAHLRCCALEELEGLFLLT